jgi:hypothetical protein
MASVDPFAACTDAATWLYNSCRRCVLSSLSKLGLLQQTASVHLSTATTHDHKYKVEETFENHDNLATCLTACTQADIHTKADTLRANHW